MNNVDYKYKNLFNYKDFSHLDDSADLDYLVSASIITSNLNTIQAIKKQAISLLNIKPGNVILELGCGAGKDSVYLASLVGVKGQVVAVDSSLAMLEYAREHNAHPQVQYLLADAQALDYSEGYFDAVYIDRLLISQKDVDKVLTEAIRVLKPQGYIVTTDLDFGTIFIYPYQERVTDIFIQRLQEIVENKFIGRKLPAYFVKHNLQIKAILAKTHLLTDFNQTNTMLDFPRIVRDLVQLDRLTKIEAADMLRAFDEANRNNTFLYGLTLLTVSGQKN